jgi:phytoene synthase
MTATPTLAPHQREILARTRTENFPVALRVLPESIRTALTAIYGYARLVDETGDGAPTAPFDGAPTAPIDETTRAERLDRLDALEVELDRAVNGCAVDPLFVALQEAIAAHDLSRRHLAALIEANRRDQRVSGYESWESLREYCRLSAEPVGRLVLEIFGRATPERERLSDDVCSALQLLEHCQDVGEDLGRGRVYLPVQDMARFGCDRAMLSRSHTSPQLRSLIAFEVDRARGLLASGRPLVASLRGAARVAVAGYVAGGHATARALARCDHDVLALEVRPARRHIIGYLLRELLFARRAPAPAEVGVRARQRA